MNRFEVRGPDRGFCAICGVGASLSADHVPPRGASRLGQVQMYELWKRLSAAPKEQRPPKFSQNGVKFRSICGTCNNVRLGAQCDPAFIDFTSKVSNLITHVESRQLVLPATVNVRAKPITVLRSVVGHVLAMNVGRGPRGPMEEAMAAFFLEPKRPIHRALDCFYWLYPYNDQVHVDAAVITHTLGAGRGGTYFKLLKFYPVAFFLTWERNDAINYRFQNLCDHRYVGYDVEVDVGVDTHGYPHQLWPECPTDGSAIMYGGGPKVAEARTAKQRVVSKVITLDSGKAGVQRIRAAKPVD